MELLRVDLGSDDSQWLIAQVRAALAAADPLDHLAVLHLSAPDRRASNLRARVFEFGIHYPAGTPERIARQLLLEREPALRLRTDVERDFDFFAALADTLAELREQRRVGRPMVDELLTAWKRIAQAIPPAERTRENLARWLAPVGPRLPVLLGAVERYRARLAETGCADPEDALWLAAERLPRWSIAPRFVIADDLDRLNPARAAFVRALAGAAARTLVILRGRRDDLPYLRQPHEALQELVLSEGGRVLPEMALPALPHANLVRDWLEGGKGAPSVSSGLEAGALSASPELTLGAPFPTPIRPATRAAEVREAARFVRRAMLAGARASDICVAMPSTGAYADLIAEVFTAAAIPYDAPFETPLGQTMPVAALLDLLRAARDGLERNALLDALASPFLAFSDKPDAELHQRLREATRGAWVVGGRDIDADWLAKLKDRLPARDLRWLKRVLALIEPFTRGQGRAAGLADAALNILGESSAKQAARATAAHALHEFERLLKEMRAEFERLGNPGLRVSEFLRALNEQARTRTIRPAGASGERVRVLGLRELRGARFSHLMILGLTDADLPLAEEDSMFLPASREEQLARTINPALAAELCAPIDTAWQADYLFAHALIAADRLVLSMPRAQGDAPFVPAVQFARLMRCMGVSADGVAASLAAESPTSRHELARAVARGLSRVETGAASLELGGELRAGLHSRAIELARTDLTQPAGSHDGLIGLMPELDARFSANAGEGRHVFSPSQLDSYVECPWRFWARYVVGAKATDEPTLDAPPHAVGTLIHATFERYVQLLRREAGQPDVLDDPLRRTPVHLLQLAADEGAAREIGYRLIREAFDHACASVWTGGPFWQGIKRGAVAGLPGEPDAGLGRGLLARFIDEEIARARAGIGVRLAEFEFGRDDGPSADAPDRLARTVDLAVEDGVIRVMGSIDRVDEGPDGVEIVDYKTGGAKTTAEVRDGVAFQLATYLAVVARLTGSQPRGMSYLLVPTQKKLERKEVWLQRGQPAFDVARLVREVLPRRLARVLAALRNGVFVHLPFASPTGPCRYCDYAGACARRDDVVQQRQSRETAAYLPDEEAR